MILFKIIFNQDMLIFQNKIQMELKFLLDLLQIGIQKKLKFIRLHIEINSINHKIFIIKVIINFNKYLIYKCII